MSRAAKRPSVIPKNAKLRRENLPPVKWQKTVLAIAEVAWQDGGRGAVFNAAEERSAVKRLAALGYMKVGHSHRNEVTASITANGHLLLLALRGGA